MSKSKANSHGSLVERAFGEKVCSRYGIDLWISQGTNATKDIDLSRDRLCDRQNDVISKWEYCSENGIFLFNSGCSFEDIFLHFVTSDHNLFFPNGKWIIFEEKGQDIPGSVTDKFCTYAMRMKEGVYTLGGVKASALILYAEGDIDHGESFSQAQKTFNKYNSYLCYEDMDMVFDIIDRISK